MWWKILLSIVYFLLLYIKASLWLPSFYGKKCIHLTIRKIQKDRRGKKSRKSVQSTFFFSSAMKRFSEERKFDYRFIKKIFFVRLIEGFWYKFSCKRRDFSFLLTQKFIRATVYKLKMNNHQIKFSIEQKCQLFWWMWVDLENMKKSKINHIFHAPYITHKVLIHKNV